MVRTVAAVVVAAGRGLRAGGGIPKQYRFLPGGTAIERSLAMFATHAEVALVQPVIHPDDQDTFREASSALQLLPPVFGRLHERYRTPHVSSALTGAVCALLAGFYDVATLGHLVSIGTLLAFAIVCGGVWWLRVKEPARPRPFRTPFVPLVPILGIAVCLFLMSRLPVEAWERLGLWLVLGLAIYFFYGRHRSVAAHADRARAAASGRGVA